MDATEQNRLLKLLDDAMNIKSHELTPKEYELLLRVREEGVWDISEDDKAQLAELVATKGHLI